MFTIHIYTLLLDTCDKFLNVVSGGKRDLFRFDLPDAFALYSFVAL